MRPRIPNAKGFISKVYERFLELPVPLVLTVLWLVGVVIIISCVLALYMFWTLLEAIAGALVSEKTSSRQFVNKSCLTTQRRWNTAGTPIEPGT